MQTLFQLTIHHPENQCSIGAVLRRDEQGRYSVHKFKKTDDGTDYMFGSYSDDNLGEAQRDFRVAVKDLLPHPHREKLKLMIEEDGVQRELTNTVCAGSYEDMFTQALGIVNLLGLEFINPKPASGYTDLWINEKDSSKIHLYITK